MENITSEFHNSVSPNDSPVRVLLVGNRQMWRLQRILESNGEFQVVGEIKHDEEIATNVCIESPDIIIVLTDAEIPAEVFSETLTILQKMNMNSRTVVLSDNPLACLEYALKAGIAALLYHQISQHDLIQIIHEVYSWSHDLANSYESSSSKTNLVLRLNQEVEKM